MKRKVSGLGIIAAFLLCLTACGGKEAVINGNSETQSSMESTDDAEEDSVKNETESDTVSRETEETAEEGVSASAERETAESPAVEALDITLPAEGEGGSILAAGENIAVPEGVECIALSEEPNVEFLFSSGVPLRNLQFVSLSFDGANYKREKFLHTCIDFAQGEMIKVSCYLPDTYSNLLLQYEDPTGEFFSFFVRYDMSGNGICVVLEDAMSTEIAW